MTISKFLMTVCVTAVGTGFISVHAQDNAAQAAARAALMEKMNSTGAPASTAQPATPPAAAPVAPAIVVTPAPAATPAQPATAPVDVQPTTTVPAASSSDSSDTPAQAAARAALMEKMNSAGTPASAAQPATPPAAAPVVPAVAMTPAPAATPVQPATTVPAASNSDGSDTPAQAAARAALMEKWSTMTPAPQPQPTSVPVIAPVAVKATQPAKPAKPATPAAPGNAVINTGYAPITAPALPIPATKEMRLQALNEQYKADLITPQEYFKQREAIINGP